jgi:S-adenosylmethionine decarboxylase
MHLVIDGLGGDPQLLADASLVQEMLEVYPDMLGMNKICPPVVVRYQGPVPEDWGISGVVIIAESHIAIHTFPKKRFLSIDIFSCKAFDMSKALKKLAEVFEIGRYETYMIQRGKEFPKDPELARQIVLGEREYLEARVG